MSRWYVRENDGTVWGPLSMHEWMDWAKDQPAREDRNRVALDEWDDVRVSTVFLGLDHQHYPGGPPLLFETMIFGGKWDQYQWRYATEGTARASHAALVAALRDGLDPNEAMLS